MTEIRHYAGKVRGASRPFSVDMSICLIDGVCVKLEDLGTFEPRQRAERKHPHNAILGGKDSVFKSKTVAHLKPSRRLNTVLTMAYESRRGELDNE